jgi:hypothetical protein
MSRLPLLALALVALALQGLLRPALQAQQEAAGLVMPATDAKGLSADVAVPTLALGAFRGLVTDYLWLRSITMREQGRDYEARQLAEQICRLQPRLSEVWSYLAHDLAYNLTSSESTPAGRWRWIQSAIRLLRDEGLRLNPGDPELYFTLSRIYQDKIGSGFDDFHMYFKAEHALSLAGTLGEPPLTVEQLNATPPLDVLLAQEPGIDRSGPRAKRSERRDQFAAATGFDLQRVLEIDREWGPLDWRGSDASAIYWAAEGIRVAEERGDLRNRLRLRRIAIQALKNAMRRGRFVILAVVKQGDPPGYFVPSVSLAPRIDALYVESIRLARAGLAALDAEDDGHDHGPRDRSLLDGFHMNQLSARADFLGESIVLLSEHGREQDAKRLLARARASYPNTGAFAVDYDAFIVRDLTARFADPGMFDTQVGTSQVIEGAWTKAFKCLALGQDERFRGLDRLAKATGVRWDRFLATLEPAHRARMAIPYEAIRTRAAYRAAQSLLPGFRAMLAQRTGIPLAELETPPPQIALPLPRGQR